MWACLWLCLVCGLLQFELCIACRVSFSLKVELSTVIWPGCYWPLSVFPSLEFLISVSCLLYHRVPLYSVHEIPIQISCTLRCCIVFRRMVKIGNLLELVSGYVQMLQLRKQGPNWLFLFCFFPSDLGCHQELECPIRGLPWVPQVPHMLEAPQWDLGCPRLWWKQQENALRHSRSSNNRCSSKCNSSSKLPRIELGGEYSRKEAMENNLRKKNWSLFSNRKDH